MAWVGVDEGWRTVVLVGGGDVAVVVDEGSGAAAEGCCCWAGWEGDGSGSESASW